MHPLLSLASIGVAVAAAALLAQPDDPSETLQALASDSIALDGWIVSGGPGGSMRSQPAPRLRGRSRGRPDANAHKLARLIKKYVEPHYWRITPDARCYASTDNTLVIQAHPAIVDKVNRFLERMRAWYV